MKPKPNKKQVSVYIKEEHHDYLKESANEFGISVSSFLAMIIADRIKQDSMISKLPELLQQVQELKQISKNFDK